MGPLLPPEVWEQIFNQVQNRNTWTSATDLTSCLRTCVTFQDILQPTQCTWQLKGILPIIFSRLDRNSILTLRQVCKTWKLTVDHFLENYQYYLDIVAQNRHENLVSLQRNVREVTHPLGNLAWLTIFQNFGQLSNFLERDDLTEHYNPFPGGSLSLQFSNNSFEPAPPHPLDIWEEWPLALDLLLRFGEHVIHLDIHLLHHSFISINFLSQLVALLYHTPNLKTLYIRFHIFWEHMKPRYEHIANIEVLPPLPHLNTLQFSYNDNCWWNGVPDFFQTLFAFRYLGQLNQLKLSLDEDLYDWKFLELPEPYDIPVGIPSTLTELELRVRSRVHFNLLETLAIASVQLKKITMVLILDGYFNKVEMDVVINYVIPFASSLQSLTLINWDFPDWSRKVPHLIHESGMELQPLTKLCSLKTLQLFGFEFHSTQGIFASLPLSIEYLHLHIPYKHDVWGPPRELCWEHKIFSDDIWAKFLKLKCISLRVNRDIEKGVFGEEGLEYVSFSKSKLYWRKTWELRQEMKEMVVAKQEKLLEIEQQPDQQGRRGKVSRKSCTIV